MTVEEAGIARRTDARVANVKASETRLSLMKPRFSFSSYTTFKASMIAFMPALALHKATPKPKMKPKPSLASPLEISRFTCS